MIRDPSDGSVKESPTTGARCSGSTSVSKTEGGGSIPPASASGLRDPSPKSDYLARLERSRQWLADYHAVSRTNPEKTVREQGETGE